MTAGLLILTETASPFSQVLRHAFPRFSPRPPSPGDSGPWRWAPRVLSASRGRRARAGTGQGAGSGAGGPAAQELRADTSGLGSTLPEGKPLGTQGSAGDGSDFPFRFPGTLPRPPAPAPGPLFVPPVPFPLLGVPSRLQGDPQVSPHARPAQHLLLLLPARPP